MGLQRENKGIKSRLLSCFCLLAASGRVLLSVRPTPRGGGGWVGLAEFQGGWVSNHPPPPPGGGVGLCGGPLVLEEGSRKQTSTK